MAIRGRSLTESMKKALESLEANPDQTINDVADRFFVSRSHFRLHVNNRGLLFKRTRNRGAPPVVRELTQGERKLLDMQRAALAHEQASAPAEHRLKRQMTDTFERLARLWGDWIKK